MIDMEEQIRRFVHEGHLPAKTQPPMRERVEQRMRLRRQRVVAGVSTLCGVAAIGGVALVGTYGPHFNDGDGSAAGVDPAASASTTGREARLSDCSEVTILTAATTTAADAAGARGLSILLEHGTDCIIGPGTRVEITAGERTASVAVVPESLPTVVLGTGRIGNVQLEWSNWCEAEAPQFAVTFTDGSTSRSALQDGSATPACESPDKASGLVVEDVQLPDIQDGGTRTDR